MMEREKQGKKRKETEKDESNNMKGIKNRY